MRRYAVIAGIVVLAFLGGLGVGRHRAPAVVHEVAASDTSSKSSDREASLLEQIKALTAERDAWASKFATLDLKARTVTRWIPAVPAANGCPAVPAHVEQETTSEQHREEHAQGGERASSREDSHAIGKTEAARQAENYQSVTVTKDVEERPAWSFTLLPGYQVLGAPGLELRGGLVVGAEVDHRFIGPLSIGAWASTSGAAGFAIKLEL